MSSLTAAAATMNSTAQQVSNGTFAGNATCLYFASWPDYRPCSGNGICVPGPPNEFMPDANGKCVCDEGWTGLGDMIDSRGMDCQTNVVSGCAAARRCELANAKASAANISP